MHILLIEVGGGADALEPAPAGEGPGDLRISVVKGLPAAREAIADEHDLVLLDVGSGGRVEEEAVAALRPVLGDRPLVLRASGDALRMAAGLAPRVDAVVPAGAVPPADLVPLLSGILARHRREPSTEARLAELEEQLRLERAARGDLLRSEERVRRVFEVASVGFAVTDLQGGFLYTNPAFCRMVGRSPAELNSLDFRSITHPGDLEESEEVLRRLREGARSHEVLEKRYLRPEGDPVWARSSVSMVRDRGGSPRQMVVVSEDITAQRIVLQRLMENERLLTIAGRMVQFGGWAVDLVDRTPHWSDQVCAIHGVPPGTRVTVDEAIAFYAPEWRPVIREAFERCATEGASFDLDLEIIPTSGGRRWVRAVGEAVRDGGGKVVRVQGAFQDISDRKRAEEELQASERRFREFAESMPLIVWSADREGRVDYITGAMSRYAGVDPADVVGEGWISLVHPEDVPRCVEAWGRSVSTGEPYALEFRLRREDGVYRWHLVRATPVRDGQGEVVRWYGSATDIDDLRTTTLKLRESEERFRTVARVTSDVLWDWDLTTDALWWGDGLEKTFGFDPGGAESDISSWTSRVHPEDVGRVLEGITRAIEGGDSEWRDEYRFQRADGSYARVRDRGSIVRDHAGRATRMTGGLSDESEWLESQARLQEQAELLDLARDAIIVRELDLTIASWNAGAERIYGWSRDEVLGRRSEEFLEMDPDVCAEALDACLREGEWSRELEQRRRDGSPVEIEARWTLVRDAAGEPRRILSIHTDITERRKLMAQFLRAQRLESIGTLAGGIAHDLNNVLSPILMAIALLKLELPEDEGIQEILSTIEGSARRGAEMVKQVLGFARGVEGQRLHVDLDRILDDLARVVRDTFPRGITFRKEVKAELWSPWGDPTQIHQVLMNLLVNARDAMPGGGTLVVNAENVRLDESYAAMSPDANPGRYVRISVRDTGTGMSPEVVDRIFDPFFTTKGVGQGTGLGLSTVQAILKSHGGFVNVTSEPGRGTTFRIHLPTEGGEGMEAPAVEAGGAEGQAPRGNGELVLVVDDEAAVRDITRQALEASGYRVVTASDGAEAVALCGRMAGEVAVVLTDLMMPIMDGPSTVRALRHIDPGLRIVASSGLSVGEGVEQVTEAGVRHFLPKPYTAESLLHILHQALRDD